MFNLNETREVWYPVMVNFIDAAGSGKIKPKEVKLKYKLLDQDELNKDGRRGIEISKMDPEGRMADKILHEDIKLLSSHITDWKAKDEKNKYIPYDEEKFSAVCIKYPEFYEAAALGLVNASRGVPAKN